MGAELQDHILSQEKEADGKAKINSDPGMDVHLVGRISKSDKKKTSNVQY